MAIASILLLAALQSRGADTVRFAAPTLSDTLVVNTRPLWQATPPAGQELQRPIAVLILRSGQVVVADRGAGALLYFDSMGHWAATGGRPGRGPGEFQGHMDLVALAGDTLAARDGMATAPTLSAQSSRPRISVGYAYASYLEEGGGSAPVGGYFSLATAARNGVELDLAYHRETESFLGRTFVHKAVTAAVGPHAFLASGTTRPYGHILFGLRHDSFEGANTTSFGATAGLGVDVPVGRGLNLRAGGDFQLFIYHGSTVKTIRLLGGVAL